MKLTRKFFAIYILRPSPSQKYKNSKLEVDQNNALEYPLPYLRRPINRIE